MAKHAAPKSRSRKAAGLAIIVWDLWRKLPAAERQRFLDLARRHGPKLAKRATRR